MLAGGRAMVNTTKFRNDLSAIRSRDDVLTVLIHLGYLAFDWERRECYVPNYEVSEELANAVEETGWTEIAKALDQSRYLLDATLRCDAATVARMVQDAHTDNTSLIRYSDENSMSCVLSIAYFYAPTATTSSTASTSRERASPTSCSCRGRTSRHLPSSSS